MMKYKMIVADFDDTVLHTDMTVSEEFLSAVKEYTARGGKFVIATGRMTGAILPYCQKWQLKGEVLTFQGGIVADIATGEILEKTAIPLNTAVEICEYLQQMGVYYHIYENDTFVANQKTMYSDLYQTFCNCEMKVTEIPLGKYILERQYSPVKILLMEPEEYVMGHLTELTAKFGDRCFITTSKPWLVEIINKEVDKGIAVARLAKKYGIAQQEIICIGDSLNDVPMVKYAGLGVMVANASEDAKKFADIIAPSCDDDGVAYIIRKFGIEDSQL